MRMCRDIHHESAIHILPCTLKLKYSNCVDDMQDLILSRALALEATTSVLLDYSARRAYDRSPQIEVAYTDMPGELSRCCPVLTRLSPSNAHLFIIGNICTIAIVASLPGTNAVSLYLRRSVCTNAGGRGRAACHQVGSRMAGGQQL